MSEQPEALRLADLIFDKPDSDGHCMKAAAELRRLHALCEEMGGVLEKVRSDELAWIPKESIGYCHTVLPAIDAALAKWKESK